MTENPYKKFAQEAKPSESSAGPSNPYAKFVKDRTPAPDSPVMHALKSAGQTVDDGVRAAANAMTFGLADKAANIANRLTGRGGSPEEQLSAEARTRSPIASVVGEVAGSALPAARIARGVGTVVPALRKLTLPAVAANSGLTSSIMSGVDDVAHGKVPDPIKALGEGVVGGLTGGTLHLGVKAFSPTARVRAEGSTLSPAEIKKAKDFHAQSAKAGVDLTIPEAVSATSPGKAGKLEAVYNTAALAKEGSQTATNLQAARAPKIAAAIEKVAKSVGPEISGHEVQVAAKKGVSNALDDINKATRPLYKAAEKDTAKISGSPAVTIAKQGVLRNRIEMGDLASRLGIKPNDARKMVRNIGTKRDQGTPVAALDKVRKQLGTIVERNRISRPNTARIAAKTKENISAKIAKSSPDYEKALKIQTTARTNLTDPLQAGPLGKLAETNDVASQAGQIFGVKTPAEAAAAKDAASRLGAATAARLLSTHLRRAAAVDPLNIANALPTGPAMDVAKHVAGSKLSGVAKTVEALRAIQPYGRKPIDRIYGHSVTGKIIHAVEDLGSGKKVETLHDPATFDKLGKMGPGQTALTALGLGAGNDIMNGPGAAPPLTIRRRASPK